MYIVNEPNDHEVTVDPRRTSNFIGQGYNIKFYHGLSAIYPRIELSKESQLLDSIYDSKRSAWVTIIHLQSATCSRSNDSHESRN